MNARGTRRPHSSRPYKRSRSKSRSGGGKKGCVLFVLFCVSFTAIAITVMEVFA